MANAELKTKANDSSVNDFFGSIKDESQQKDSIEIDQMFRELTKLEPKMWGSAIVGYGDEHLVYESGRELDWFKIGFSPRKQNITLYILKGGIDNYHDLLESLGKYTTGKGCLYIKTLKDVNLEVLKQIMGRSLQV